LPNHHIHIEQLSDAELVKLFKNSGAEIYFAELYQRYTHLVFGTCMKYLKNQDESKDATMEIFEKLLSDFHRHEIQYFKSWLYTVAKNHCLMKLRKNQQEISLNNEEINHVSIMENDAENHHLFSDEISEEKLKSALMQLDNSQKICVELFYLKNKSYQQIVDDTGFSTLQVKSYIQNGKRNLKNILQPKKSV
jgi:RNA polymerase sigma factor (sigma-70 family)